MTQTKARARTRRSTTNTRHSTTNGNRTTATRAKKTGVEDVRDDLRKAGRRVLKVYEETWDTVADYQDKAADKSRVDWLADVARAQARVTRKVSKAYGSEARKLIG